MVLISWDGAADWVVDRLLAEGKLPHLDSLRRRGTAAAHSLSPFPSKTAVGHATLWTGAWPGVTGVTSNQVARRPPGEHTLLDPLRGFDSGALLAEPLYLTAALAGRRVVLLSATHNQPPGPYLQALDRAGRRRDQFLTFSGFQNLIAAGQLIDEESLRATEDGWSNLPAHRGETQEFQFEAGESLFFGLIYDSPEDPTDGFDRVLLRQDSRESSAETILEPRPASAEPEGWSRPFRLRLDDFEGGTCFRLFDLAADGSRLALYQWQSHGLLGAFRPEEIRDYEEVYPAFHDDAFGRYRDGELGRPLPDGGDGQAEERLLEIVALDTQMLASGIRFALENWSPELLWHYSPMADSAGHTWMGILDPASPSHDPALAKRLWPFYIRVFQILDRWLGEVLKSVDAQTLVALVSDHGMEGADAFVHTNRILEEAGLLTRDADGEIDLTRTRVLGNEAEFYVRVNGAERKGGIVPAAEREAVLRAAREALLKATDPKTGQRVFQAVFEKKDLAEVGLDRPVAGDLYLDAAPGFYPTSALAEERVRRPKPNWGGGVHGYWPERRKMHAIFYLMGPGVVRGHETHPIRHIDIAPTLAHLLGLPAPAQSQGRVIEEFLDPVPAE